MITAICGQGRLGGRIATLLTVAGISPMALRLDRERGLLLPAGVRQLALDCLLLCLVPRDGQATTGAGPQRASLGWQGLLDGLVAQVARGEVTIGRVVHVSSTAAYDGYDQGWISADTPARGASARAAALIDAETKVRLLATDSLLVRLTGIYGPGYERYDPLAMSQEQARMGIDVRAAAAVIAKLVRSGGHGQHTALVTDGQIYHQGQAYPADPADPRLARLAQNQRLLLPSHAASWPPQRSLG